MLADDLVARGDRFYREGYLDDALYTYNEALRDDPWSPQALCGKALVLRQRRAEQARVALMAASAAVGYKRRRTS